MSEEHYEEDEYEEEDVENSAEDEYSDDAEASDEEAIDGTDEASDDEMEHVEWGFEPKKRRFSKEVVIGLGAVSLLVGIFAFVAHNQLSGDGENVAAINSEDGGAGGPESDLGASDDPPADGTDPFDESGGGASDLPQDGLPSEDLIGLGSDEPPVLDELGGSGLDDPLVGQMEPGLGGQPATGDAFERRDPFGSSPTDPYAANATGADGFGGSTLGTTDPSNAALGTASDLSSDPFGSQPLVAESLPIDPGLPGVESEFGSEGVATGTSQPAATLPEGDLLGSSPAGDPYGTASTSLDEPFGNEPAVSLDTGLNNERPRGLFDNEPTLTDSTLDPELTSDGGLGQPIGLGQPETTTFGAESGPDSLPLVANDGELSTTDPYGQPIASDTGSGFDSLGQGNDSLLSEPDLSSRSDPFGSPSADQFQQPIVGTENDPLNSGTLDASPGFDSPTGPESSVGSPATIVAQPEFGSSVGGSTYTVQENDSFWAISRKVYGTSKYFEALQTYNRSKVSDPKKLRPGMVLDTPSPSILADYLGATVSPQAIADGGRSGLPTAADSLPRTLDTGATSPAGLSGGILPVEPAAATQSVETTVASSPSQTAVSDRKQGGFFIGNQGYPMYRVAKGDTLTAIAADHLGRASRWKQIFRMNQDTLKSPNALAPGAVLKLPGDASRVPLIDRTSSLR